MESLQGHDDEDEEKFDPDSSGKFDLKILSQFIQLHDFADKESTKYEVEEDIIS